MKRMLIRLIKFNALSYVAFEALRDLFKRKAAVRAGTADQASEDYDKQLARWQWLRGIVIDTDERRLRSLIQRHCGTVVPYGPFEGLKYQCCVDEMSAAMRLGFFEAELHPYIEQAIQRGYTNIVNVGCSFGYYAVGFARRTSDTRIYAYDVDAEKRDICSKLAAENEVSHRIEIGARFELQDFERFRGQQTVIFCDIEGAETELLDPVKAPALAHFDLIVELHDVYAPGTSQQVTARFEASHDVTKIKEGAHEPLVLPAFLERLGNIERFIACHGGKRWGATPWAVLCAKNAVH